MKYFWIITFGLLGICSTNSLAQQETLWFPVNHRIDTNITFFIKNDNYFQKKCYIGFLNKYY
jgi:hypothetical protein